MHHSFFLYSQPDLVRKLLEYRYSILDAARENTACMDKGALYTWRTINGHEASGNFLGSTVRTITRTSPQSINISKLPKTGSFSAWCRRSSLKQPAAGQLERVHSGKGGRYCINEVCGPDEYKPGVNNSCYQLHGQI